MSTNSISEHLSVTTSIPGKHRRSRRLVFWVLVGPAFILFAVLMLWPLINMFYVSTLDWRGIVKPSTFAGLKNYARLFGRRQFYDALKNTGIHILFALPGVVFPGFMLGYFLSQRRPGYRILRTIYFSPVILSRPAAAMLFLGIYLPDGILNTMLRSVGLESWTRIWLADMSTSLGAIIAIDFWGGIGFYAVLFFAVLSNVPHELYEAARLDGAGYWTMMWRIAFPVSLDFFGIAMVLHFTWLLLGAAQNVLLLTEGGPGTSSLTLGFYLYEQAFQTRMLGYSQAIGVFIFFIGIVGMFVIRRLTYRNYNM